MPGSTSYKASKRNDGPSAYSSRRHHYITQDWVLLSAKKPDDRHVPLQYKVHRAKLRSFAPLYTPTTADPAKRRKEQQRSRYLPEVIKKSDLKTPPTIDSKSDNLNYTRVHGVKLRGSVHTLQSLNRKWESSSQRYHSWRGRKSVCGSAEGDAVEQDRSGTPKVVDGAGSVTEAGPANIIVENKADNEPVCIFGGSDDGKGRQSNVKQSLFAHQVVKPTVFDGLLDSRQHFPEESVSSEEEAKIKRRDADKQMGLVEIPEIHQRKYRRLRRATKDLIVWIDSLKPSKPLNYHLVTQLDGTRTNVAMKPYMPYPEEDQPFPIIDENAVVEMVINSYGSRPAMTLRVAVRDMERLPEELEKFDNVHYLKRRVIEDRIYRKSKKLSSTTENSEAKPITRYSFGFNPEKPRNRRISAVGTVFDVKTGRHCRYGAWYLRRSTWHKMDASEEIKKPGGKESDEQFERVTGQKRLHAVDLTLPRETSDQDGVTDVSHLHIAKEFYKLQQSGGRHIPAWLNSCEGALQQIKIEEANRTAPFGSEVWRKAREVKNELTACQAPGTPVESLLQTDHYCYDTGYVRPDYLTDKDSEEELQGGISAECYAFLEDLERGVLLNEVTREIA